MSHPARTDDHEVDAGALAGWGIGVGLTCPGP
jgi:hypothetical protein